MSLDTGVKALAEAIGTDVKSLNMNIGDLSQLPFMDKSSLVGAITEFFAAFIENFTGLVEYIAPIDDDAGLGDTNVTWSADKSSREIGELYELIGDVESVLVAINGEP